MLVTLAFCLLFPPQTGQIATVEGKVLDSVTNQPLAGARVILLRTDKGPAMIGMNIWETIPAAGEQDLKASSVAVLTGEDGAFRFRLEGPVKFRLFADLGGYVRTPMSGETYKTNAGEKAAITLKLTPESTIAGRVIDDETGQPLKGLRVSPEQYRGLGPSRLLVAASRGALTDENGRYKIEGLAPGEYYLEVRTYESSKIVEPKPVKDFTKAVQKTYAPSWYPGVPRAEEAVPVRVVPGAGLEGMDFKIRRRVTAAVRGRILLADGTHAPSEEIELSLFNMVQVIGGGTLGLAARGKVKVGSGFEIDRLSPGTYWLDAQTPDRTRADKLWVGMLLHIGEENQDGLDLFLRKGATVTGRVRIEGRDDQPDQPALPGEGVQFHLTPLVRVGAIDEQPVPVRGKDGSFHIEGVIADKYRAALIRPPEGYKISEVRYNGTVCKHGIVPIDLDANGQNLDITLARGTGSVVATVTDGSDPVPGAAVLLMREPIDADAFAPALRSMKADKDGRASFTELLPGTYRMTAYPADVQYWGNDPNLRDRLVNGQEVRVSRDQAVTIQVRTEPIS